MTRRTEGRDTSFRWAHRGLHWHQQSLKDAKIQKNLASERFFVQITSTTWFQSMIATFASKFVLYHTASLRTAYSVPDYHSAEFHILWVIFYGVNGLAFLCYGNTVEMGKTLQTLRMFLEHKYNLPFIRECTGINMEHQNATKFVPTISKKNSR